MQDKITIADAPDCLNTNDKAMWVLGYQAALAARSTCLHQIQEPAPAQAAPAVAEKPDEAQIKALMRKHRIWIEHSTLFEDDEPPRELRAVQAEQHQFESFVRELIALAATPAAAPVDKSPELQGSVVDKTVNLQDAAAAPVVLPEPVGAIAWNRDGSRSTFHAGCRDKELLRARLDEGLSGGPYRTEFAFTETQVRTLLATATGLPAQAVEDGK